jgi:hypothetical protein
MYVAREMQVALLAQNHQRFIHHYAANPTLKTARTLERLNAGKNTVHAPHEGVFRILLALQVPAAYAEHHGSIPVINQSLGLRVLDLEPFNDGLF